jgi:hypothetical protein
MFFGYDMLRDLLLEMLNLINIGCAVVTRRNLVDPIQRGLERSICARKVIGSNPDGYFFHFIFPFIFFIFMCNFFSPYFSILSPFFSPIDYDSKID